MYDGKDKINALLTKPVKMSQTLTNILNMYFKEQLNR